MLHLYIQSDMVIFERFGESGEIPGLARSRDMRYRSDLDRAASVTSHWKIIFREGGPEAF